MTALEAGGPAPLSHEEWARLELARRYLRDVEVTQRRQAVDAQAVPMVAKYTANNAAYEAATKALTADYPQLEKDTWPTQNEQTAAWVADPVNASTPWIDRAAAERGIDREEYLRRTLVKAEQFKILSAFLTGRRQRYEDQIKAGNDPELDYALTLEVQLALQQVAQIIMNPDISASDLQGALS